MQIITLSDLGGAQSVVANLSNYLCKDNELIVVAGEGDGKLWELLDCRITKEHVAHLKRSISIVSDLLTLLSLLRLYLKHKPDVVHLHSSKIGVLGRIVFPRSKTIYTVHGFDSIRIAYRKFLPFERVLQKECKAIVGVSKYDMRNLLNNGITHHVHMVYNGIVKPSLLKKDPFLFCEKYSRKVLCIARLSPQKNSELFLKTAALLPNYAFIWIGNQYEVKEVYSENVFFMGNLSNAGSYSEYADLFILPSNYEGLPMVILEAMSFGKPVVASDVGGISEIVVNDENGYTVENEAPLFANKIEYILQNKNVYENFSKKAIERFEKELTVDKMGQGYMQLYQS